MPFDEADYRFNPFDITKVWPHKDYPLIDRPDDADRNPADNFAQITQVAFEVGTRAGHRAQPGSHVLGRIFAYGDSPAIVTARTICRCRSTNRVTEVHNYNKDGPMRDHHRVTIRSTRRTAMAAQRPSQPTRLELVVEAAEIMRTAYIHTRTTTTHRSPERSTRKVMRRVDRDQLVGNIVWQLSQGVERFIQERAVKSYLSPIDPDLGVRVAKGLGLDVHALAAE